MLNPDMQTENCIRVRGKLTICSYSYPLVFLRFGPPESANSHDCLRYVRVPAGILELIDLQRDGFAYIKP
ncbi:hypothetical protein Desti_1448 [Desulfomonile tiedjei DSM 6799]|uniref:Uncharacterized protein n=1 Tax=Desulfomonile tiedjei (strain ATCC 49306 / DSM 6799 / DCB-1) TaxID=706587 RepID=I4C3L9_DESTA|nr:hypothetical protein Desti_1448 [Desulfomonile tiedjei DSM 6799]